MGAPATSRRAARSSAARRLDRWFSLDARGTTVRTELVGGLATFLTMSYIIFVNPAILSAAGMPFRAVAVATAAAAAVAAGAATGGKAEGS